MNWLRIFLAVVRREPPEERLEWLDRERDCSEVPVLNDVINGSERDRSGVGQ